MKLIKLDAIGSTNDYLKALRKKVVLEDEIVVQAHRQSKGRGQAGAYWYSETGKSLSFSMFKRVELLDSQLHPAINWAVSLGVKKGLEECGVQDISIKWPNDILAGGSKIGGILIENQWQGGTLSSTIIGIGLNVNNLRLPDLPRASSLLLKSGITWDLQEVLVALVEGVSSELSQLSHDSLNDLKMEYEAELFRKGVISEFENETGVFLATIIGVTNQGELALTFSDGSIKYYDLKQLKLRY